MKAGSRRTSLLVAAQIVGSCAIFGCRQPDPNRDEVCFSAGCFRVEVAQDSEALTRGLQHRSHLPRQAGMLFIFPRPGYYPFWIKDTLLALDILWLAPNRRVVDIAPSVPPCREEPCLTYSPKGESLFVLEINAGQAQRMGLKAGDEAVFHLRSSLLMGTTDPR